MTLDTAGEALWVVGVVAWYIIRYPFERRARRVRVVRNDRSLPDTVGLALALFGLAIFPALYVFTGFPAAGDYPAGLSTIALGTAFFSCALWLFRSSHKALGRNWSISLEIREKHKLVCIGPYAVVRHPMYTSFLLMAVGQALLLSNWVVALAGLAGFAFLFFLRIGKEEHIMLESFGPQYRAYMERTKRIIPYLY
ncbi:protein-S-isoprenylcysteine O-methyltransferase [Chelativorans sp. EGI FJ00035]|uniref:Protein-S-isoprenylcysteine O-methyltransferase n=1 Tax=Chelativorans salis TaxID=2978478 RepID=A0ABT2LMT5_9HYPH|nr:protein-S-isoprenylcysteine O-methyltransferase [Chelativorans sp. EGI FJ00035]MCT7374718.1 protein-S-isoprenylcysteine O-methyltransferase [Chelativorans sp. EGI FJ00035]